MFSPNLNPIRFTYSTTLFQLRDSVSQTELILLPPNLFAPWIFPVSLPQPAWLSKPKKLDTHLWFLSSIPFNQANTKFYYPIILISLKFVYFSPFVLLTPCPPVLMIIISSSGAMLITSNWTPCIHSCILPGNIFYANLTMSLPSYNLSMISKRPENRVRMP